MSSRNPPTHSSGRRSANRAPEDVDVDVSFDADGLYALRATLAAHASRLGAPQEQIEHLLIVASELATNAIRHGGGTGSLRFWRDENGLVCEVSDHGPGFSDPTVGLVRPDPTHGDGGRGIWICRNLARELVIDDGPQGRGAVVTAVIPIP